MDRDGDAEEVAAAEEEKLHGDSSSEEAEVEGEVDAKEVVVVVVDRDTAQPTASRLHTQHPVAPIHVSAPPPPPPIATDFQPTPQVVQQQQPPPSLASLNSRRYTNRISLLLFLLHLLGVAAGVGFFGYKAVEGLLDTGSAQARRERRVLRYWLPPIEGVVVLGAVLGFAWQRAT